MSNSSVPANTPHFNGIRRPPGAVMSGVVYIIQLEQPLGGPRHFAEFYVGWTTNLDARLAEHRSGNGAAMLRAAVERGIAFDVIIAFPGTRADERRIKRQKNTPKFVRRYLKARKL